MNLYVLLKQTRICVHDSTYSLLYLFMTVYSHFFGSALLHFNVIFCSVLQAEKAQETCCKKFEKISDVAKKGKCTGFSPLSPVCFSISPFVLSFNKNFIQNLLEQISNDMCMLCIDRKEV